MTDAVHTGHRERRRDSILAHGAASLAPHELIETLLFYAIPYRDTNPLAHRICNAIGTPAAVLTAEDDILREAGLGEGTIRFFRTVRTVVRSAFDTKRRSGEKPVDARPAFIRSFYGETKECVRILLRNNSMEKIYMSDVGKGGIGDPTFRIAEVLRIALLYGAADMTVGFSHASGLTVPTSDELRIVRKLQESADMVGVNISDIFLFGGNRYTSLFSRMGGSAAIVPEGVGDAEKTPFVADLRAEALADLLRYAVPAENAIHAAGALLSRFAGLSGVLRAGCRDTRSVPGVTERAAVLLRVIGECMSRYSPDEIRKSEAMTPEKVARLLRGIGISSLRETVHIILLDEKDRLIDVVKIAEGVVNTALFLPRVLLETAISAGADGVMLLHTHPFGLAEPSQSDICVTASLQRAFEMMDMRFIEHILLSDGEYELIVTYMREHGL